MYAYNSSEGVEYKTGILHNNSFTFLTSYYGYALIGDNGWGVEYDSSSNLRFFSTPAPYSTIKNYDISNISPYNIFGDYFYYSKVINGNVYLYKLDRIVGSSPIVIQSLIGPSPTTTSTSIMAISKAPPLL